MLAKCTYFTVKEICVPALAKNTVIHCGNIVKLFQIFVVFFNPDSRLKPLLLTIKKIQKLLRLQNCFCLTDFNPTVEKSIERSVCKGKMAWDTSLWQNMKQSINTSLYNVDPKMQPAKVLEISTTVTDCYTVTYFSKKDFKKKFFESRLSA